RPGAGARARHSRGRRDESGRSTGGAGGPVRVVYGPGADGVRQLLAANDGRQKAAPDRHVLPLARVLDVVQRVAARDQSRLHERAVVSRRHRVVEESGFAGAARRRNAGCRALSASTKASLFAALVFAASVATVGCGPSTSLDLQWNDYVVNGIEAWRAQHEADYRRDWATIEGLHFLSPGTHTAGSAAGNDIVLTAPLPPRIGTFTVADNKVAFDAEPGAALTINGKAPTPAMTLRDDGEDTNDEILA